MKKFFLGLAAGAAASYVAYKLHKEGKLDALCDDVNALASKTKKNLKDVVDVSKNQAEYIKDRVAYEVNKGKERLNKSKQDE